MKFARKIRQHSVHELDPILRPRPRKYRNIVRHLSDYVMTSNDSGQPLTPQDIFNDLSSSRGTNRFLGFFSERGIRRGFELFGVIEKLEKQGLTQLEIELDTLDPYIHTIRTRSHISGGPHLCMEQAIRRGPIQLPDHQQTTADCFIVEWFLLQNPIKSFSKRRPQLPGQDHPGLGVSMRIFEILYWSARRLGADGVLFVPNYLHTGLFYGRQCAFLDPVRQGELLALRSKQEKRYGLDQFSWACSEGQLLNKHTGQPYLWTPAPMALPVSRKIKDWFYSAAYTTKMRQARETLKVKIRKGYRKSFDPDWTAISNHE